MLLVPRWVDDDHWCGDLRQGIAPKVALLRSVAVAMRKRCYDRRVGVEKERRDSPSLTDRERTVGAPSSTTVSPWDKRSASAAKR